MKKSLYLFPIIALFLIGCGHSPAAVSADMVTDPVLQQADTLKDTIVSDSKTEAAMRAMGLVEIQEQDSTIQVHLMYATPDNFMHRILYADIHKAFALQELAEKLKSAQTQLKSIHPGYSLIIYDAARPVSVQREMWETAKQMGKTLYVANPEKANGLHNYGAAVDISIIDGNGRPLDMGTPVDWFGPEAHISNEAQLVADGKITKEQLENRLLLRKIMKDNGFLSIRTEWWHFEIMRAKQAKLSLKLIE